MHERSFVKITFLNHNTNLTQAEFRTLQYEEYIGLEPEVRRR